MIICENNTVFDKSDFWSKMRQPAPVSPTRVPARKHICDGNNQTSNITTSQCQAMRIDTSVCIYSSHVVYVMLWNVSFCLKKIPISSKFGMRIDS